MKESSKSCLEEINFIIELLKEAKSECEADNLGRVGVLLGSVDRHLDFAENFAREPWYGKRVFSVENYDENDPCADPYNVDRFISVKRIPERLSRQ